MVSNSGIFIFRKLSKNFENFSKIRKIFDLSPFLKGDILGPFLKKGQKLPFLSKVFGHFFQKWRKMVTFWPFLKSGHFLAFFEKWSKTFDRHGSF